ncbi:iron-containing alcohol dehydrogenase [Chromobacterium subtsugae]|uniref:Iron-containing alcohol dehydrogenase n=1 Tax=Chromobacterium subtsugae TaxID=251747 RepID=A0ABS7FGU2_9NEIS|nr:MULTISPECIES: iron-containing alcohol dehydrogenase [Chromobacterium]KUM05702.1 aldehyde reductase [Chromobacterium subtsugae]KZE84614.1 aldehyde reductase [Chromobacterium sp. F49]MBW7568179.1 iron-containing alcohol dehydrogenase [Chromobacterium subtsugae]MBW8289290.1 iron-containing alcohol dehydrogenase [Chromobacterium subtsugae]WSE90374.1 iron-containing alcohol dehydrogenase [Chromobacterium subtsugae]
MNPALVFDYYNPTHLHFGGGQLAGLERLLPAGARILLLYGGGSIKRNGIHARLQQALRGHDWLEFGGVAPNPDVEALAGALALLRESRRDFILAAGGGSVIDAAKYLAAAALHDGDGWELVSGKQPVRAALPLGVVLTLAATGSEGNGTAVISRLSSQEKLAFRSPLLRPRFAVLDPDTLATLPDRQLANGVTDAFVHACEQYLTYPVGALVQDGCAEAVLRALYRLACRFDERGTPDWRQNMMWAANQALSGAIGLGVPHDWATHGIGRALTALYGIDHGRTLSIVQPSLLREACAEKAAKLRQMGARVFDAPELAAERVIDKVEDMYRALGMPVTLAEAGVPDAGAAADDVLALLRRDGRFGLGEGGILIEARVGRIVRAFCR